MKVFISWSGEASKAAALALHEAIREVFNGVEPWVSAEDIGPGQEWFGELMATLKDTRFAIACLTRSNLSAPWVMFESGAVSAHFGRLNLVPLLLEGDIKQLADPMARFNGAVFDQAGMLNLFRAINKTLDVPMTKAALDAVFTTQVWPRLEKQVQQALRLDRPRHDVFVSVPMAAFETDEEYQPFRTEAMKVVTALREQAGLSVYCAMDRVESLARVSTASDGAQQDIDALEHSANFVLLYPRSVATSALFEAGYALARGMPCRFFVRDQGQKDLRLPFLLRKLPEVFTNVSIMDHTEWTTYDDIVKQLLRYAPEWFGRRARAVRERP